MVEILHFVFNIEAREMGSDGSTDVVANVNYLIIKGLPLNYICNHYP